MKKVYNYPTISVIPMMAMESILSGSGDLKPGANPQDQSPVLGPGPSAPNRRYF